MLALCAATGQTYMMVFLHKYRILALLLALSLSAVLAGMFTLPVLNSDEAYYAQASAQMATSGDYVQIHFLDQPRHRKPAGLYWAQAIAAKITGQLDSRQIWAWRLPSLLGHLLSVFALYRAGLSLLSKRAAFWGAALFAVSLLAGAEGGLAVPDALLTGLTSLCMAILAHLYRSPPAPQRGLGVLFWVALASAIMVKGPVAPLIVLMAIALLVGVERRAAWLRPLSFWPGPVLAALIVLPWFIAIEHTTEGGFIADALGRDFFPKLTHASESHHGFIGQHALSALILLFPASLFIPSGVRALWRSKKVSGNAGLFLLAWIAPWWIIAELLPTKLFHYTLPTYPALALIAGLGLVSMAKEMFFSRLAAGLAVLVPLVIMIVLSLTARGADMGFGAFVSHYAIWLLLPPGVGLLGAIFLWQHKIIPAAMALIVTALSLHLGARGVILPALEALHPDAKLVAQLERAQLLPRKNPKAPPIIVSGYLSPALIFLVGGKIDQGDAERAARGLKNGQTALVERRQRLAFERWCQVLQVRPVLSGTVQGLYYTRGQWVIVDIMRPAHTDKRT